MTSGTRPHVIVLSNQRLFDSFFTSELQDRLSHFSLWTRLPARSVTPTIRRRLAPAEAFITTWDSPVLGEDLLDWVPKLRIIAHCCAEVKARGDFPASRLLSILSSHGYQRYISFEWEKKWHPDIPELIIALPHFVRWVRRTLAARSP